MPTASFPAKQQLKSWRDVLPVHPACGLIPSMSADELRELGEDIKKTHRVQLPISLIEADKSPVKVDGKPVALLDGRSRLDALEATGHRINFTVQDDRRDRPDQPFLYWNALGDKLGICTIKLNVLSKRSDPYAHVLSINIHRRHLSPKQKRELIGKLLQAQPEKSDRQIAETAKASHHTVGAVRAKMEGRGQIAHVETRTDTKGRKQKGKKGPTRRTSSWSTPSSSAPAKTELVADVVEAKSTAKIVEGAPAQSAAREAQARAQDVGPGGAGEVERLHVEIERLTNEKHRLEIENLGLRSQYDDLWDELKVQLGADADAAPLWSWLNRLLNTGLAACERESNWPPLNADQKQRRAKAIESMRTAMNELLKLAFPKPPPDLSQLTRANTDGLDIPEFLQRAAS